MPNSLASAVVTGSTDHIAVIDTSSDSNASEWKQQSSVQETRDNNGH